MAKKAKEYMCPACGKRLYVNQSVSRTEEGKLRHRNCHLPPARLIYARGPVPTLPKDGPRG